MILELPFYENNGDGEQCFQVAMQIVIKYFLDKEYTLEELDQLLKRKHGKWIWAVQVVTCLYNIGLNVKYYLGDPLESFLEGEKYIRERYGKNSEKILEKSDLQVIISSIKNILDYELFEKRVLSLPDIESLIERGFIPIVLIDYNVIIDKEGAYQGHALVVTGFDDEHIYCHESGPDNPTPNKKIPKDLFIKAWGGEGADNATVVVFGRKQ